MTPLTSEGEAGQDFVGSLGPFEGLATMIRGFDMTAVDLIQHSRGTAYATPNLFSVRAVNQRSTSRALLGSTAPTESISPAPEISLLYLSLVH